MIKIQRDNSVIAYSMRPARSFTERLLGLMGRRRFPANCDAMLFENCNAVHCCFMLMSIDVIFIDRTGCIVKQISGLRPWHLAFGGRRAASVIELPAGTIKSTGTVIGDILMF